MSARLPVIKTHKLFINGRFPRSESGRSLPVTNARGETIAHLCRASRKDLREAVTAATSAQPGWWASTAYLRGQILYRFAEMLEGRAREFADAIAEGSPRAHPTKRAAANANRSRAQRMTPDEEVRCAVDRLVSFAGWCDKFTMILGGQNPVAGPYYNFTTPEPIGTAVVVAPDAPALLGAVTLLASALCAGNAVVLLAGETNPIPVSLLGEVCAVSDVPAGVVNILTGTRAELVKEIASHRDVGLVVGANLDAASARLLHAGTADNLKRVTIHALGPDDWNDSQRCDGPEMIEPCVEMKTIWHPSAV